MDFTFTDSQPRFYVDLGVIAEPGKTYTLDSDPGDGRWTAVDTVSSPPTAVPAKEGKKAVVAPDEALDEALSDSVVDPDTEGDA